MSAQSRVAAVVAAAGRSTRMGAPKQLLPWGDATVIAAVVHNLFKSGATPVIVAVGHEAASVEEALAGTGATVVFNPEFAVYDMLCSFQVCLGSLDAEEIQGALMALGDQPHIPIATLRAIVGAACATPDGIVIPSYDMRRGHPIYLPATLFPEVIALDAADTLRSVLERHADLIRYVTVDTPAVLRDIDTPADYEETGPGFVER